MTARDRYLSCMPNFHIDFQCSAAMPMLMTGGTLILLEKYSARRFWRQVCLHRATLSHAMPLIVRTLMLQPPRAGSATTVCAICFLPQHHRRREANL